MVRGSWVKGICKLSTFLQLFYKSKIISKDKDKREERNKHRNVIDLSSYCQCMIYKRHRFDPWVVKIPWRRAWQLTPVFLPGESQGQGSLVGCSLWGRTESDTTEVT